ncbi:hypothetical protein FIBSPDRAFT_842412 [Athelia psychrophila]|uniref:Uncharacterized protein n=1 Tax=Athelia psychrophila TaxID=1759441 RepID=A0A167WIN4_9AGAM|nr:hypothetical protein FIBSPDRAFT_842412 [Fibularhizoctonia sp. CBS 109695]
MTIQQGIPLGTGPPSADELRVYYPAQFTWDQLKTFINAGDLGLLKRSKSLQARYDRWIVGINAKYGSSVNYLNQYRLRWGEPDTLSALPTSLGISAYKGVEAPKHASAIDAVKPHPTLVDESDLFTSASNIPAYFMTGTPAELISIIQNDWPYSVPPEIEHILIWTRLPIINFSKVPLQITGRLRQDGLWGFTGSDLPPPSPSTLPECLPALADWGVTMDSLISSPKASLEEEEMIKAAGTEVDEFVKKRWVEGEWETSWFVNPPQRLQSVPDLSHIHVFARRKSSSEMARADLGGEHNQD